ncbi:hypothetical protein EVAR_8477_1 [Eumeta japonica]|uniref:Uncharacterized protein n=1 Tax=Eumeta variegata TaxID=151549 RepID=A0A4C1XKY7_EUMVA|nr:hypothetical protein EVAR_8477_1 [Eumeta japonica]
MPNLKQPRKLEMVALSLVGDWVALQAEELMAPVAGISQRDSVQAHAVLARKVDQLRCYLEYNVPWMVYDILAKEVIRALSDLLEKTKHSLGFRGSMAKFVSQMNVAVAMTEVLFTKYLTVVSIDSIPKMMRSVFYVKLHKLTGLTSLNLGSLSGGWKTADMEQSIIKSLKTLHRLKNICINYDATDNILRCIEKNCPLIERLDLSCSKNITNESIDIIINYKNLRSIQLYRTSVTLEGYTKLLLKCKKLEDIGRCEEIGKILEYIDLTNSEARPFMLTTYVSRYAPINHLQLAVDMCPRIRSMTVFHNTLQSDLMVLVGLPQLCELKLLSCDFYADQVKQLLQVKGCNITSLHLEHVDQIDLNALMYISQMCPMLRNLTLYNCTLIQHTSLYTRKLEILPFRNLKKLTFVAFCTESQIMFLLTNCLNIEFIHLGTAVQLTDDMFMKILNQNPLIHLKELRIMQSDFLTIVTVERLIHSCMSLDILVELECWSLLTDSDRDYIRNYIKINNFNVDTTPIRRYDV